MVLRGDPSKLNAAAKEMSAALAARAVLDPNKAMSALELTDLAKSTLEASRDNDLALGAVKLVGSTAFGIGVALFASPFLTPLGGAAVGFMAGKIYEELFDYARCRSSAADLSSDLPENWQKTTFPFDPDLCHVDGLPSVIDPICNRNFQAAQNWVAPRAPLVLDLDNDGIEAVGINPAAPILFDMDGDGIKTATGWIKADDGMVVLDLNGNGLIDSGRELFGDATILTRGPRAGQTAANGYEALADLDINGDGAIKSLDAAYASLRIWQETNQDGISQASEMRSLVTLGTTVATQIERLAEIEFTTKTVAARAHKYCSRGRFNAKKRVCECSNSAHFMYDENHEMTG